MYEGRGLIADIREAPEDLGLRRIHADWLEENGEPHRATFVRLQLDRQSLPRGSGEELALRQQAQNLLNDHWEEWTKPFRVIMGRMPGPVAQQFTRPDRALGAFPFGLLEALHVEASVLMQRGEELFELAPLRRLDLYNPAGAGTSLGTCRHLRWVETLAVTDRYIGPVDLASMEGLARSPHLGRLRELWLPHGNLGDRGALALGRAAWLPQIRSLSLSDNGLSIDGIVHLASGEGLRFLVLDLSLNEVGSQGLASLTESGALDEVRDLRLIDCRIGDEGVRALAGRWSLTGPESLYLRDNAISDEGARALAEAPWIERVRFLDLADNRVGPAGRDCLVQACCTGTRVVV